MLCLPLPVDETRHLPFLAVSCALKKKRHFLQYKLFFRSCKLFAKINEIRHEPFMVFRRLIDCAHNDDLHKHLHISELYKFPLDICTLRQTGSWFGWGEKCAERNLQNKTSS